MKHTLPGWETPFQQMNRNLNLGRGKKKERQKTIADIMRNNAMKTKEALEDKKRDDANTLSPWEEGDFIEELQKELEEEMPALLKEQTI